MQRLHMQDVGAVLGQHLPVGAGTVLLDLANHLHALHGLVHHDVDVLARIAEVIVKAHRIGVEIQEPEASVRLEARHRHHVVGAGGVEVGGVGLGLRDADRLAGVLESPAVVDAAEQLGTALLLARDLRAAMGADVEEAPHRPGLVAQEDDGPPGNGAGEEVVGLGELRIVPDEQPALGEDFLHLRGMQGRIGVRSARNAEPPLAFVDADRRVRVRALVVVHYGDLLPDRTTKAQ